MIIRTLCLVALLIAAPATAAPLDTTFTYQGELSFNDTAANGSFDFVFTLHDAVEAGAQVGDTVPIENATVSDGVFTVELDFGTGPFAGDQLWLGIGVREGTMSDPHELLRPRQKLTAAPYALHAEMVGIDAITSIEIVDNTITQTDIASNAVGSAELANNAVDSAAIAAGAVATNDLADNAVTSAKVASDTLTAEDLAAGSVGSSEIVTSQVQQRVNGTCDTGTYLAGINEDGTVHCAVLPVGLARTLDSEGIVGRDTSLAIRTDGRPIISYRDLIEGYLKVYDCANSACSAGTDRIVDDEDDVGSDSSVAIRADGLPIISYRDFTNQALKVYDCANTTCSAGTARTLDSDGVVGAHSSVAIRADGRPIISYRDRTEDDLKVFDCANAACSFGIARRPDSDGDVGLFSSVAIRSDGLPIISYYDSSRGDLRVYSCGDPRCEN